MLLEVICLQNKVTIENHGMHQTLQHIKISMDEQLPDFDYFQMKLALKSISLRKVLTNFFKIYSKIFDQLNFETYFWNFS